MDLYHELSYIAIVIIVVVIILSGVGQQSSWMQFLISVSIWFENKCHVLKDVTINHVMKRNEQSWGGLSLFEVSCHKIY